MYIQMTRKFEVIQVIRLRKLWLTQQHFQQSSLFLFDKLEKRGKSNKWLLKHLLNFYHEINAFNILDTDTI